VLRWTGAARDVDTPKRTRGPTACRSPPLCSGRGPPGRPARRTPMATRLHSTCLGNPEPQPHTAAMRARWARCVHLALPDTRPERGPSTGRPPDAAPAAGDRIISRVSLSLSLLCPVRGGAVKLNKRESCSVNGEGKGHAAAQHWSRWQVMRSFSFGQLDGRNRGDDGAGPRRPRSRSRCSARAAAASEAASNEPPQQLATGLGSLD
jgi:hypothetical protein